MTSRLMALMAAAGVLASCGGSSDDGTTPSPVPAATITITGSGVSPKSVTVPRGSQVQFVNNDTRSHQMNSDAHPEHTDCPELNAVGFLAANQSRLTGNLNTPRTCGYHDHDLPNNTSLHGTIVVQ
jgi:plastocyanin